MLEGFIRPPQSKEASGTLPTGAFGLKPESTAFIRLDLVRFIASLAIVVFHYAQWLGLGGIRVGGFHLFVDVFFVISGLVITHVYLGNLTTLRQITRFWIARLVPLHWALTLIYVLLGALAGILGMQLAAPDKYDPACLLAWVIVVALLYRFDWEWWERSYDMGALRALPGFLMGMTLYLWRALWSEFHCPSGSSCRSSVDL